MKHKIEYMDHVEVDELDELAEQLITVNRCAAVVKGGRRFSFSALVVLGNRKGIVGYGFGKARQVPGSVEKANKDGRKHLQMIPLTKEGTIPHEVHGEYCGAKVLLIPSTWGCTTAVLMTRKILIATTTSSSSTGQQWWWTLTKDCKPGSSPA